MFVMVIQGHNGAQFGYVGTRKQVCARKNNVVSLAHWRLYDNTPGGGWCDGSDDAYLHIQGWDHAKLTVCYHFDSFVGM